MLCVLALATGMCEGEPLGHSAIAVTLAQQEHVVQRMQRYAAEARDDVLNR